MTTHSSPAGSLRKSRRSELATPASNDWMFEKAAGSRADLVFLDLEDAVAPARKVESRALAAKALSELDWGRTVRAIRMNGLDTPWAHGDVVTVMEQAGEALDTIIIPKVRTARDVWWVDVLLTQLEHALGRSTRVRLEVLIEEVEALENVFEIAHASDRLDALIFGAGDYSAAQGARVDDTLTSLTPYEGDLWHYARFRMAAAARSASLMAVDGPYPNFKSPDGYRQECLRAGTVGFDGKWAIHPTQIELANSIFTPSEAEIARAHRIIEIEAAAASEGLGATSMDGHLVDAANARHARGILQRAQEAEIA